MFRKAHTNSPHGRHNFTLKDIYLLFRGSTLYAINAGDSRSVASIASRALALSVDHKPGDEKERERIEKAGGFVEFNRVNGNLALSRALGDFAFKGNDKLPAEEQIVSGCPEVVVENVDDEWEFVLLACDGIWDVLGNQESDPII
jgi:protein phosphatase 2C family protein 2/3